MVKLFLVLLRADPLDPTQGPLGVLEPQIEKRCCRGWLPLERHTYTTVQQHMQGVWKWVTVCAVREVECEARC